jgi:hypothetical protein
MGKVTYVQVRRARTPLFLRVVSAGLIRLRTARHFRCPVPDGLLGERPDHRHASPHRPYRAWKPRAWRSARLHVTRLFNTRNFELGSGGLDFSVGKKWAIGGMITLTPYGGWDLSFVGAGTNRLVDFNEGRTQAQAYASPFAQLAGSGKYTEVGLFQNPHNRFYGGARFVGGIIQIIAEVSAAGLGSITVPGTSLEMQLPPVLAFNVGLGLDF